MSNFKDYLRNLPNGRGHIKVNLKKENSKHPHKKGFAKINGKIYSLAIWIEQKDWGEVENLKIEEYGYNEDNA